MGKTVSSVLLILLCYSFSMAQDRPDPNMPQGENLQVPEGWEVLLDREMEDIIIGAKLDSSDIYFVNMTPGWHITSGPAAIYYHPANTASGKYGITSEIHFFDPGDRNREAYGLFLGGKNLENENQEYLYFLIRNTGEFLIKKRMGEETEIVQDWAASDVILKYENQEVASVQNILSVDVSEETINFNINDKQVGSINSSDYNTEGIFGFRVNHSINLHISDLSLIVRN